MQTLNEMFLKKKEKKERAQFDFLISYREYDFR